MSIDAALDVASRARLIAIGERHDNPAHHAAQGALVESLDPDAVAFEMITEHFEDIATDALRDGATLAEFDEAVEWSKRGWPDISIYAPLIEAVRGRRVIGGALSRLKTRAIVREGFSALGADIVGRYALHRPLSPDVSAEMLAEQVAAHCDLMPAERLGGMVTVQRAWDAAYADALRRAGEGGGRAVLICGNGHARTDRGAPAMLRQALPGAKIVGIGLLETGETAADSAPFDGTITTDAPDRDDPCDAMRRAMQGD